jgi:hypothetical protein
MDSNAMAFDRKRLAQFLAIPLVCSSTFLLQPSSAAAADPSQGSLPDAGSLLHSVEANQKRLDEARENYTYREIQTVRRLDSTGNVKGVDTEEREEFFIKGHRISKLVKKNGKPLSPDDAKKEEDRVSKEVAKFQKQGEGSADSDDITVARLLEIVKFSNPRRISLNGRKTIALDFVGDPHAKTHGRDEEALKKVYGTIWIDEADREVSRMSATLDENYHVGFGLLASVAKGSTLVFDQGLIRNQVWLPTGIAMHLQAKAFLVVGVRANVDVHFDQYLRFQASAEQQTGDTVSAK